MKLASSVGRALVWVAGISFLLLSTTTSSVSAKAILGVDLGSLYMKVALVQRGAPLEIVTNMHSKRKTEQMILFDQGTRFYGADASSLLARKPTQTPVAMSIMLGRDEDHPAVKVRSKSKIQDIFERMRGEMTSFESFSVINTHNSVIASLSVHRFYPNVIIPSHPCTMKHERV